MSNLALDLPCKTSHLSLEVVPASARWSMQPGTPASFGRRTMAHPALWGDKVAAFLHWLEGPREPGR